MRERFSFLKRWLGDAEPETMLALFTPRAAEQRSTVVRVVLAGATLAGVGACALLASGALALLLVALAGIFFLVTQVMGIELDLNPEAMMDRARQYASQAAPN